MRKNYRVPIPVKLSSSSYLSKVVRGHAALVARRVQQVETFRVIAGLTCLRGGCYQLIRVAVAGEVNSRSVAGPETEPVLINTVGGNCNNQLKFHLGIYFSICCRAGTPVPERSTRSVGPNAGPVTTNVEWPLALWYS